MQTQVTANTLSHAVDFDSPFRVNEDGTITHPLADVWAPEIIFGNEIEDKEPEDRKKHRYIFPFPGYPQWELISGWSGQDRYSGPVMHNSEYLGGSMAEWVLENPGVYVLMAVSWEDEETPYDETDGYYIEGWVLARKMEV